MNESILKQVNLLVQSYGLPITIIISLMVLLLTITNYNFFAKIIGKLFSKLINRKPKNSTQKVIKVRETDIINHEIFNLIDVWIYSHVPTMQFDSNYRNVVFRKYLTIYYKSYKKTLTSFVESGDYKIMDNSELRQTLLKLLTDTVYIYEREMHSVNIPDVIINKMKIKNNITLNLTIDLIDSIFDSRFNSEYNLLKVLSLLNILSSLLENNIINSISVCNSINGELKGLTMDGHTE